MSKLDGFPHERVLQLADATESSRGMVLQGSSHDSACVLKVCFKLAAEWQRALLSAPTQLRRPAILAQHRDFPQVRPFEWPFLTLRSSCDEEAGLPGLIRALAESAQSPRQVTALA